MRKLIPAIIGLSLIASAPAWSQQQPTSQSADWYMEHPGEMERALDWCHTHPDEANRMAVHHDQACNAANIASGNLGLQKARRAMRGERE